jgi:hypothetical protein
LLPTLLPLLLLLLLLPLLCHRISAPATDTRCPLLIIAQIVHVLISNTSSNTNIGT